jgi:hypothetical protein
LNLPDCRQYSQIDQTTQAVAENDYCKQANLARTSDFGLKKTAPKMGATGCAAYPFSALRNSLLKNNIAKSLKNLKNQLILIK